MALKTRTRSYSFDRYVRKGNDRQVLNMINNNCILFPDRVVSTELLLLCEISFPPQQQEQGSPACGARTWERRREAALLLLLVLQSGAVVAMVWAHSRTQELCL